MFELKTELEIKPEISLWISVCKGEREVSNRSPVRASRDPNCVENIEKVLAEEIPDHIGLWSARKGGERLWFNHFKILYLIPPNSTRALYFPGKLTYNIAEH